MSIQLIYPGSTTASHILNRKCFDKAVHAHLLIESAICQSVKKHAFTDKKLGETRTFMDKVADDRLGARHTASIVAVLEQRFDETFEILAEGGRASALWVQYHYMIDLIKIITRVEMLSDNKGQLPCTLTRMLNTVSAVGHHQYAKGVQLYGQLMKKLETSPEYKETFEGFSANGNHVVRYSCHK